MDTSHRQTQFQMLSDQRYIECDELIAEVILELNDIPGVFTENSCWSVIPQMPGYVNIRDENGGFCSFLEQEINSKSDIWLDYLQREGVKEVMIRPKLESADLDVQVWWNNLRDLAIKFKCKSSDTPVLGQKFSDFYKRKTTVKVWEMELPVVNIDDLIKMKKKARRDKDNLDIEAQERKLSVSEFGLRIVLVF